MGHMEGAHSAEGGLDGIIRGRDGQFSIFLFLFEEE